MVKYRKAGRCIFEERIETIQLTVRWMQLTQKPCSIISIAIIEINGLMNAPHQIHNVDESGVPLDPKALNVVAKTGYG